MPVLGKNMSHAHLSTFSPPHPYSLLFQAWDLQDEAASVDSDASAGEGDTDDKQANVSADEIMKLINMVLICELCSGKSSVAWPAHGLSSGVLIMGRVRNAVVV
jgi:hypothetical protein